MTQILGLPRLRELREAKGMKMGELAKAVGVSLATVSYWEIGKRSPMITTAAEVAEVLGVELGELLGIGTEKGTVSPSPPAGGAPSSEGAEETPQPCAAAPLERGAEEERILRCAQNDGARGAEEVKA